MAFCPQINSKQVRNKFNSIVTMFDGTPLSLEEFKSVKLRNKREGNDLLAMNVAYEIWNRTKGNNIPRTRTDIEQMLLNSNIASKKEYGGPDLEIRNKYFKDSNITTTTEVLEKISVSKHPLNKLAKKLLEFTLINDVNIELVNNTELKGNFAIKNVSAAALYDPNTRTIQIAEKADFVKGNSEAAILHEILHSYTYSQLRDNSEANKEFERLFKYVKNNIDESDYFYQLENLDEFIVGLFTNARFIYELQNMKAMDSKKYKNFFEEVLDYILSLFDINKKDTVYSQAVAVASNILEEAKIKAKTSYKQSLIDDNAFLASKSYVSEGIQYNSQGEVLAPNGKVSKLFKDIEALVDLTESDKITLNDIKKRKILDDWIYDILPKLDTSKHGKTDAQLKALSILFQRDVNNKDRLIKYKNGSIVEKIPANITKLIRELVPYGMDYETRQTNDEYRTASIITYMDTNSVQGYLERLHDIEIDEIPILKKQKQAEQLYLKTRSKEFKEWFGDSKVVDENGEPLMVYHGTTEQFTEFDKNKIGAKLPSYFGKGFYFRPKKGVSYGDIIMPAFLNIQNPDYIDNITEQYNAQRTYTPTENADGVIVDDVVKKGDYKGFGDIEYVVFEPNQIKSVFNKGQFSRESDNIYKQSETIQAEIDSVLQEFVDNLTKRFKVPSKLISKEKAREILEKAADVKYQRKSKLPKKIQQIVNSVLEHDDLKQYKDEFSNIEILPLIANRINMLAKVENESWYDYKSEIVAYIAKNHPNTWAKDGIVYSETPFGQVSWHVFENEEAIANEYGISNKDRTWSGKHIQFEADNLLNDFVDDIKLWYQKQNDNIPAGFFDGKTAYIVKGVANKTTAIHEIFTHPFLLQIEKTNPELYKNLLKEAKSNKDIVEWVNKNYSNIKEDSYFRQIIGVNANLTPFEKNSLQKAIKLENDNTPKKEIFRQTGWEKGVDNKWRYEIEDGKLKKPLKEIKRNDRLKDVYDNPKLFEAYPELKEITLELNNKVVSYNKQKKHIVITENSDIKSLIHEIQHGIQDIENFISGTSLYKEQVKLFESNTNKNAYELFEEALHTSLYNKEDYISNWVNNNIQIKYSKRKRKFYAVSKLYGVLGNIKSSGDKNKVQEAVKQYYYNLFTTDSILNTLYYSKFNKFENKAYENYNKQAGEVEARNVEFRYEMSKNEKEILDLEETEDVVRKEQLFQGGTKKPISQQTLNHEYIARAIDLYTQNELDKTKDKNLIDRLKELLKQMSDYLKKLFDLDKVYPYQLDPRITLEQLSKFALYAKTNIPLVASKKEVQHGLKIADVLPENEVVYITSYSRKVLEHVNELDNNNKSKLHYDNKANTKMLQEKVVKVNQAQNKVYAYVARSGKKIKGKLAKTLRLKRLTPKQSIQKKYDLIKLSPETKLIEKRLPSTDANRNVLQKQVDLINKNEPDWRASIKQSGNIYEVELEPNIKKIDDIISIIKNEFETSENVLISDKTKDTREWKYMVNKMGLDDAKTAYKLNKGLLSISEVDDYINKYNNPQPNPDYYKKYDLSYGDQDIEYDNADPFAEEETEYVETNSIYNDIDDIRENINSEDIDVNLSKLSEPEKGNISEIVQDFNLKLQARIEQLHKQIAKTTDLDKKRKIRLEKAELQRMIRETEEDGKNLWSMLNIINNDIGNVNRKLKEDDIGINELKYYDETLDLWRLIIKDWQSNTQNTYSEYLRNNIPFQKNLIYYQGIMDKLQNEMSVKRIKVYKDAMNKIMNKQAITTDLEKVEEIGKLKELFTDLSRTGNKLTDSIFKFLNNAENAKTRSFNSFSRDLDKWLEKLKKEGHNIASKEFQTKFLEKTEDGDLTGNLVTEYSFEFYKKYNEIERLHKKLNTTQLSRTQKILSKKIRQKEKETLDYIDMSKLVNDDGMLLNSKLIALEQNLLKKYDKDLVDKLVKNIKNKYKEFQEDALAAKKRMREKVEYDKEFESIRIEHEGETEEDVKKRIDIESESMYKRWYNKHNPFDYVKRLNNNKYKLKGNGYKYLTFIPKNKFFSTDYQALKDDTLLYNFYKFYKTNLEKYIDYLPEHKTERLFENFLPYIKKTTLQKIRDGENKIQSLVNTAKEKTTVSKTATNKTLNVLGEEIYEIPVRYLTLSTVEIDNIITSLEELPSYKQTEEIQDRIKRLKRYKKEKIKNFDTDIIKSIKSFASMAENYKYYNQVESTVLVGESILNDIQKVKLGKFKKQSGNKGDYNTVKEGAKNVKELTDYTIRAMMYDQKKDHRPISEKMNVFTNPENKKEYKELKKKLKVLEQKYTANKIDYFKYITKKRELENQISNIGGARTITTDTIVDSVVQVTGAVNLGYNTKAAINNYIFGKISLITHAAGEEDFTRKHLSRAFKLLNKSMVLGIERNNELSNKIKNLSEVYNVVYEVNEAAYGVKSSFDIRMKKFKWAKPYWMTRQGEYYLQNAAMIAILLSNEIKVKNSNGDIITTNLFEIYDTDGNIRTDLTYYNETTKEFEDKPSDLETDVSALESNKLVKITDRIQQLNKMIHGNYDPRSPMKVKAKEWGRAVMQYKTWLPEGTMLRFEREQWDDMLGRYRKGRYRTIMDLGLKQSFKTLITSFFNKNNIKKGNYKKEVDYSNMMKNIVELRWVIGLTMANLALYIVIKSIQGDQDDEDERALRRLRNLLNQLTRLEGDLTFYMSPGSILNMIKNPAPAIRYMWDFLQWTFRASKILPSLTGDNDYTFGEWAEGGMKFFPVTNEVNKWKRESEKLNRH